MPRLEDKLDEVVTRIVYCPECSVMMDCVDEGRSYGSFDPRQVIFRCTQCGLERLFKLNPYTGEIEHKDRNYKSTEEYGVTDSDRRYSDARGTDAYRTDVSDYASQDQSPRENAYGGIRKYFGGAHYKTWLVIPFVFVCVVIALASVYVHPALPVLFGTIGLIAIPKAVRRARASTKEKIPESILPSNNSLTSRTGSYFPKALLRAFCAIIAIVLFFFIIIGRGVTIFHFPEDVMFLLAASVVVAAISNATAILVFGLLLFIGTSFRSHKELSDGLFFWLMVIVVVGVGFALVKAIFFRSTKKSGG